MLTSLVLLESKRPSTFSFLGDLSLLELKKLSFAAFLSNASFYCAIKHFGVRKLKT